VALRILTLGPVCQVLGLPAVAVWQMDRLHVHSCVLQAAASLAAEHPRLDTENGPADPVSAP
jgi:hypothetical protein